jgi:alkaline phosphatase
LTLNDNFPELLRTKGAEQLTAIDSSVESGQFWGSDPTIKYGWGNHSNRPVPVYHQGVDSEMLTEAIGEGFESYGFKIPGLANAVDQVNIAQTMFASVTEENQGTLVSGTNGNDTLIAGVDLVGIRDNIFTGAGNDEVDLAFGTNARNNRLSAGTGMDTIYVSRKDRVNGGSGDDYFNAIDGQGENRMSGGAGNDIFDLGQGDRALGGDGDDQFYVGEGGDNLLSGGAGADQFWLLTDVAPDTANTVADFTKGTDVIGIASQGASVNFASLTRTGNSIALNGDTFAILTGVNTTTLTAADFVFM